MTSPSRSTQFVRLHKILKKYYKPVEPNPERPVLEHLLFACCLEDAHYEKADEVYAALVHTFFDWNEIRVTTVKELAEVMGGLPQPATAAQRVKRVLQHVFEASYCFDLEDLRKKNLGPAIERLEKTNGITRFGVAYVVQSALGGHWIPLDGGALRALRLVELITDGEVTDGTIAGLERAIPKNKGVEFGSLVHQLGADLVVNPYVPALHKILLQINPDIEARLPKRRARMETAVEPPAVKESRAKGHAAAPPAPDAPPAVAPEAEKVKRRKRKAAPPPDAPVGTPAAVAEKAPPPEEARPPEAAKKKTAAPAKDAAADIPQPDEASVLLKRSTPGSLAKRKPR